MAKYSIVLIDTSGNHSSGTYKARSIGHAIDLFRDWVDEVNRYADMRSAVAYVFFDECDYPEFGLEVGPRGGIRRTRT